MNARPVREPPEPPCGAATSRDYASSKRLAGSQRQSDRRRVGADGHVPPEILYFLATDADPRVRAAVAANQATPAQANLLLARDLDDAVRCDLAAKIAGLVPGLSADLQDRLRQSTLAVLDILVLDQVTRVRQIIAETLKDVAVAPAEIIARLARDEEIVVAAPLLECSPILTDDDLLAIIAQAPVPGALAAIARRGTVSASLADAIGASTDIAAIGVLLANPSAQIREETLDRLIEQAPGNTSWHRPLVERPSLPGRLARKLASFVATHLLDVLRERSDLDPGTANEISAIVLRRLEQEGSPEEAAKAPGTTSAADALEHAMRLKSEGQLDEAAVLTATASDGMLARAELAVLTGLRLDLIDRVLVSHSPKGVTALAWKAGLPMRAAVRLQIELGRIAPSTALRPRRDGSYPLTPDAMRWQLEFLTGVEGL